MRKCRKTAHEYGCTWKIHIDDLENNKIFKKLLHKKKLNVIIKR